MLTLFSWTIYAQTNIYGGAIDNMTEISKIQSIL